ncbi:MAG: DsrE family protein [Methanoregula sp.]|jgi:tRNA 2-thiouridine synthesizing protein C|uniref:DsrE family protein n=1 Tax=Methanoregula sp. TaxID=2052170 RepID=UPI003D107FEF
MTTHFFLLSTAVSTERLSWIEECLKFFFVQLYPETLVHRGKTESPVFTFFVTGDALYSLEDPDAQEVWSVILSLTSVKILCDRRELELRGISIEHLRMKYPDHLIDQNGLGDRGQPSFWKDVADLIRKNRPPLPDSVGWLQSESPYMHRSAWYGVRCLSAALEAGMSVELYAYLDGIHIGHIGQNPTESENIGRTIEELHEHAFRQGLQSTILGCNRCATARGYSTWDDGQGVIISTCTIRPFRIRDMNAMIDRLGQNHIVIADNAGSIQLPKKGPAISFDRAEKSGTAPPVTILVTKSPYSTEHTFGAVSFAVACAHQGILTRVIFMEDGVYALAGTHKTAPDSVPFNLQDVINAVAGSENLHFFALIPSFQKRGVTKSKTLNAVLDIGFPGLGKIFFYPPANVRVDHQRILFF